MAGYSPIDAQVLGGKAISRAGWRIHRGRAARARGLGVVPGYSGRTAGVAPIDLQVLRGMPRAGLPGLGDDSGGDFTASDLADLIGPAGGPDAYGIGPLPSIPMTPPPVSSATPSNPINVNSLVQQVTAAGLSIAKSLATPPGTYMVYNPKTGQMVYQQGGAGVSSPPLGASLAGVSPLWLVGGAALVLVVLMAAKR